MSVESQVAFKELSADCRLDAEYYRPELIAQAKTLSNLPHEKLSDLANISDGNHLSISEVFSADGIRYLRGQDLKDFFIADSSPIFIPESEYNKLTRSHIRAGDVLVGIVGTIGSIGLVTNRFQELTGNCKLAIVRSKKFEPEYIAAVLASKVGQNEITRRIRGTVQMGLILPDLREIPIPTFSEAKREGIRILVQESYRLTQESIKRYHEADNVFFDDLGISSNDSVEEIYFQDSLRASMTTHRLDAEFFQPSYSRMMHALKSTRPLEVQPLGDFLRFLTNGHTPLHHDLTVGEVPFLTAEHVGDFRIDYASDKRILLRHHQGELKRTALRQGDVLFTIKGKVGNAAVVDNLRVPTNINQDVALLRSAEDIPAYFLVTFLNSPAGKAFARQYSTGQINPFLGLGNVKQLPIPRYEPERMLRIANKAQALVSTAREAKAKAEELLTQAKEIVTQGVEKA